MDWLICLTFHLGTGITDEAIAGHHPCYFSSVRTTFHYSAGHRGKLFPLSTPVHVGTHQIRWYLGGVKVPFLFRSPLITCPWNSLHMSHPKTPGLISALRIPTYHHLKSSLITTSCAQNVTKLYFCPFYSFPISSVIQKARNTYSFVGRK